MRQSYEIHYPFMEMKTWKEMNVHIHIDTNILFA